MINSPLIWLTDQQPLSHLGCIMSLTPKRCYNLPLRKVNRNLTTSSNYCGITFASLLSNLLVLCTLTYLFLKHSLHLTSTVAGKIDVTGQRKLFHDQGQQDRVAPYELFNFVPIMSAESEYNSGYYPDKCMGSGLY